MQITEWTPTERFQYCMMIETNTTINRLWIFPYYYQQRDFPNKWGFCCAVSEENTDANLPLKYEASIGGWGVKVIQYLVKTLPKETTNIIKSCENDGHAKPQDSIPYKTDAQSHKEYESQTRTDM